MKFPAWTFHPWILRLEAGVVGIVFLAAAYPKIGDPPAFAQALAGFAMLPQPALAPSALTLPWLELLVGLSLIVGLARRSAALVALVLLLTFAGALGWNLHLGHAVDCGCFGGSALKSAAERFFDMKLGLARNLILALLTLHLVVTGRQDPGRPS